MRLQLPKINLTQTFDKDPFAYEPKPKSAWGLLLVVSFVLLVILGVVSFLIYRSLLSDAAAEKERIVPASQTIDKKELQEVLDFYASQKLKFEAFLESPETVPDPSI